MPRYFRYRARNLEGRLITGELEVDSRESAIKTLVQEGLFLLDVREAGSLRRTGIQLEYRRRVSPWNLMVFTRQFATMVLAGLPLLRCLNILEDQTSNPCLRAAISQVKGGVESGLPLWESLSQHPRVFSRLYVQMVKAGEMGALLAQVLERLATHLEREHELKSKVRNALLYPGLVAGLALAVVFFMVSFVMPTFAAIYMNAGAVLPITSQVLMAVGGCLQHHLAGLVCGLVAVILVLRWWGTTATGSKVIDRWLLRLPLFGKINARLGAARFARTMGILLRSGIPILVSLEVAEGVVGNRVIAEGIGRARAGIRGGGSIDVPLDETGVFEPMIIQMITVGEETGSLDEMLVQSADYYEKEVGRLVDTLVALLEPALILAVAMVVGLIVLGTLLPLFQMVTVLG